MKIFLSCLCFCIFFNTNAQEDIVYIPDPKLKNWLLSQDYINTNADNEIQISEAVAHSGHIGIGNSSSNDELLMDATGVEAFVNLTTITIVYQSITNIDLGQNTLLIIALLAGNEINTINLDNNLVLESVSLNFNNLTEVDVSNNSALTTIHVDHNVNLTQVNLANGNNSNMSLASFRTNIPNLTCVQIDPGFVVPYPSGSGSTHRWWYDDYSIFSEDCWQEDLAVEEVKAKPKILTVYPNPVKTTLNIKGTDIKNVKVYNVLGQQIKVLQANNTVNVERLAPGTYVLQVEDQEGNIQSSKFIKK